MQQIIDRLRENIISQAKYFLKEMGEFFPFAAIIDNKGELSPVGIYLEDEHPSSIEVITEIEKGIRQGFKEGKYRAAAIGSDVFLRLDTDSNQKISAIEVRIATQDNVSINYYIPYELTHRNEVELKDCIKRKGTFNLLTN